MTGFHAQCDSTQGRINAPRLRYWRGHVVQHRSGYNWGDSLAPEYLVKDSDAVRRSDRSLLRAVETYFLNLQWLWKR